MQKLKQIMRQARGWLENSQRADFLAPLFLRIYLVPIFWLAGMTKLDHYESTVEWFGNSDWGLGLPLPGLLTAIVVTVELGGAVMLAIGLATRWVSIPLMLAMLVAGLSAHGKNGWLMIASGSSEASLNLQTALGKLQEQNPELYAQMVEYGKPVILSNGIEYAATYFIMLLVLFFIGGGRYISVDHWIRRWLEPKSSD